MNNKERKSVLISPPERHNFELLTERERFREDYWSKKDPILETRLRWRAQVFRHLVHLVGGLSILEFGSGGGTFSRILRVASRDENEITSVPLAFPETEITLSRSRRIGLDRFVAEVREGKKYDYVVAHDMLDARNAGWFLGLVFDILKPGGRAVFFESNPWNPLLNFRRFFSARDRRLLLNRLELYELVSEIGFIRVFNFFHDFVYTVLARVCFRTLAFLSALLENAPMLKNFSATIVLHAQKPPRETAPEYRDLAEHPSLHHRVSFVIPCFDEEMNIESLVDSIRGFYDRYIHEIVLVDDNSRDATREKILCLARGDQRIKPVLRPPPGGVGLAIRDGLAAATGDFVVSMDCDFGHLLPEFRELFSAGLENDVVIGSRFSRSSVLLNYPFGKIIANRIFHILFRFLFRRRCRDLTNNLKIFRREVVDALCLESPGFSVNAETGIKPLLQGWKVREVPISWINRGVEMGHSSFTLGKVAGGYLKVLGRAILTYHPAARRFKKL